MGGIMDGVTRAREEIVDELRDRVGMASVEEERENPECVTVEQMWDYISQLENALAVERAWRKGYL